MFFEVAFIAFAAACPIAVFWAYRQGIKDGRALRAGEKIEGIAERQIPCRPQPMSIEQEREQTIFENIMSFDGTSTGQKEVPQ